MVVHDRDRDARVPRRRSVRRAVRAWSRGGAGGSGRRRGDRVQRDRGPSAAGAESRRARGLHVLVEKPIATTVGGCARAMIDGVRQRRGPAACRVRDSFLPAGAAGPTVIASGEIGELGRDGRRQPRPAAPGAEVPGLDHGPSRSRRRRADRPFRPRHGRHAPRDGSRGGRRERRGGVAILGTQGRRHGADVPALRRGAVGSVDPSWSVPAGNPWSYDFFLRVLGTTGALDHRRHRPRRSTSSADAGRPGRYLAPFGVDIDAP